MAPRVVATPTIHLTFLVKQRIAFYVNLGFLPP
jgi:hypothetical protein